MSSGRPSCPPVMRPVPPSRPPLPYSSLDVIPIFARPLPLIQRLRTYPSPSCRKQLPTTDCQPRAISLTCGINPSTCGSIA
jgi:hypothetical protein